MRNIKYPPVFLFLILSFVPAYTTMQTRSTFEEYEGSTPQECGWIDAMGGNGIVILYEESQDSFQTQLHGGNSLRLFDPNNISYCNAYKTLSNSTSEYMVEFYFWLWSGKGAPIDSFPLCVLWDIPPVGAPKMTDIALVIDTFPSNDTLYAIHVKDASGFNNNQAYLDTSDIDTWHKIQIHRHPSVITDAVDLYFNGNTVGTFTPMNLSYKSTKISLGTTASDSLSDGEIFYDDVIVTTVPSGEHPRLLFSAADTALLRDRKDDDSSTISESYKSIWGHIKYWATQWMNEDTIWYDSTNNMYIVYPFAQPGSHSETPKKNPWMAYSQALESRLNILSFRYLIEPNSTEYRERADSILMTLCGKWNQWTDPDYDAYENENQYSYFDLARLTWSISIAYDILFNDLSNYEKMTVQNTLISLGLTQTYLCALYTNGSLNPWLYPNSAVWRLSSLGIGVLATDGCSLQVYLDTARVRLQEVITTEEVCDSAGGWSEGIAYAHYGLPYLLALMQADPVLAESLQNEDFLTNHARWRLYSMLRVDTSFTADSVWEYTELNFCDYQQDYFMRTSAMYRLASLYQDGYAQWYIDKRDDLTMVFFPYLWLDDTLSPLDPDALARDYLCKEIDWAILRSGWDIDDCVFAMKGDSVKGHAHFDRNSFLYGKDGTWFIEDWGYAHTNDTRSAASHNVLIVNNEILTNGGEKGEITACYGSSDYGYLRGEAGDCYEDLDIWNREVVVLYDGGHFVVKDWIKPETGQVDTLRWQVHSYIISSENDSLTISTPLATSSTISKDSVHLRMEFHKPVEVSIDTTTPFSRTSYKRISEEIADAEGIDSILFLTSYVVFGEGENCPEVSDISADSMVGLFIDTDADDNAILFSRRGNTVTYTQYEIDVPASYVVLNVLADMAGGTYKIDDEYPLGVSTTTSYKAATSEGTLGFEISGSGTHRITMTKWL